MRKLLKHLQKSLLIITLVCAALSDAVVTPTYSNSDTVVLYSEDETDIGDIPDYGELPPYN